MTKFGFFRSNKCYSTWSDVYAFVYVRMQYVHTSTVQYHKSHLGRYNHNEIIAFFVGIRWHAVLCMLVALGNCRVMPIKCETNLMENHVGRIWRMWSPISSSLFNFIEKYSNSNKLCAAFATALAKNVQLFEILIKFN